MKRLGLLITVLGSMAFGFPSNLPAYEGQALLDQAKHERSPRVRFADQQGAEVRLTEDGKSFLVEWFPPAARTDKSPYVMVTIGGHSTFAFDDFSVWHPFLKNRKLGFLALQWWLGENERRNGYLTPEQMYAILSAELKRLNIQPGHVLLHGFSRGSANTYALAALDRESGQNYFGMIIANAGGMASDYPPNREIEAGEFGERPFEGTRWITFAGGKDPRPGQDGIPAMRETGKWIEKHGGHIVLALEDTENGHGGFHMNPENANQALDLFENNS